MLKPGAHRAKINRQNSVPLYQQLYVLLRDEIDSGRWQPGDLMPTEANLREEHGLSRATVRQALDALVNDGLIYRERGRGTYVAHPTVHQALVRIVSFTEDMRQRGFTPGTRVLAAELLEAPPGLAEQLGITPGEELARIERLRLADGEPMSVEQSHLIHRYCPGILAHDYALNPLREMLEREYGIRIASARQSIRAVNAPRGLAQSLAVAAGAALLLIERVSYSQYNLPVEFLRVYHRGDRYLLYNELRG